MDVDQSIMGHIYLTVTTREDYGYPPGCVLGTYSCDNCTRPRLRGYDYMYNMVHNLFSYLCYCHPFRP